MYGAQIGYYLIPLVTVPYLSRVLGPASWGLLAMAQSFAMYGGLIIEYGFIFSATRQVATASSPAEIESIVADVFGARVLLAATVAFGAWVAYFVIPLFHKHPLLLSVGVCSEVVRALTPAFYFYGIRRVAFVAILDVISRLFAAIGIFVFVHRPQDAWRVFALNFVFGCVALAVESSIIYSRHAFIWPRLKASLKMLYDGGAMFLFRSASHIYSLSNAFILGIFAPPVAVGYYAGAEKINSAAVGLLSPLSTVLYPRSAALIKDSFPKAVQLTKFSLYVMGAVSIALMLVMWFASGLTTTLILGHQFEPSSGAFRILSLRAPMVAWTNVLGFQWLLVLGLEKSFQRIVVIALVLNFALAALLAPRFSFIGMSWAVVASQAAVVIGIYVVLRRRKLNPLAAVTEPVRV